MYYIDVLPPLLFEFLLFVLGIVIGSFLNVVIYRLPIMLKHKWGVDNESFNEALSFNLLYPRSHCTKCMTKIPEWSNIPLIGYLILRGKCFFCKAKISIRYPIIEFITGVLFAIAGYLYGDLSLLAVLVFISFVICLVFIDFENFILPDELTLPLLWLGLLFNIHGMISGSLENSVIGAMLGYLILWSIYWIFKLITKRDAMGYGDFKFLAAILAMIGYEGLVPITFSASILGIIYFVIILIQDKISSSRNIKNALQHHIPFGPFLGAAAILYIFASKYFVNPSWFKFF